MTEQAVETRQIMDADQVRRAMTRIAHEVLERTGGAKDIVLVGLHSRGVPIARRLATLISEFEDADPPVGSLDIGL